MLYKGYTTVPPVLACCGGGGGRSLPACAGFRFRVRGVVFGVWGLGSGFEVDGLWLKVWSLEFKVEGAWPGLRVQGVGCRV